VVVTLVAPVSEYENALLLLHCHWLN